MLIERGSDVDKRDENQETPLDIVSGSGHLDIARLLLKSGSNPNFQDSKGWTPLHRAAQSGHLQIVTLLLASGAEVNITNGTNDTSLDLASRSGKLEVARLLAERTGTNLQETVGMSRSDVAPQSPASLNAAQAPFEYGELARKPDNDESISLHTASEVGNLAIMQSFLDSGAEVNKRNAFHRTPLYGASRQGKFEAARLRGPLEPRPSPGRFFPTTLWQGFNNGYTIPPTLS